MLCENAFGLGWFAAWYFVIFVMIGIMVLVSLFSGVIITSMDLLRDSSKAEAKVMNQAKRMQRLYFYDDQSFDNLLEIFEIIDTDSNGFLSVSQSPLPYTLCLSLTTLPLIDQRADTFAGDASATRGRAIDCLLQGKSFTLSSSLRSPI